ncbi:MAG: thioredoxin family protein [Thermoleophilaceae bacterium]|nr:thioredoxin family protein [Thermoleophilaceae bacterium]
MSSTRAFALVALTAVLAVASAGCGGGSADSSSAANTPAAAQNVNLADFPKTDGTKTVADLQREVNAGQEANLLPAANNFVAGRDNRLPFGLFNQDREPIWGPTAMYLSAGTDSPATGPFKVAANDFSVPAEFQSETSKSDLNAIGNGFYVATIPTPKGTKKINVLTLTKQGDGFQAAATGITTTLRDPTVAPGEKAPAIETPTVESAGGDISSIDTRVPPDDMHDISLKDALKKNKPIVLIFATPKLCASRVCAPVVDVAAEVQHELGDDVIFIHQEIYKDNDINAGYRPQVAAYGLTSEPYTFVIAPDGRVAEQLQGPFVASELRAALAKAGVKAN